MASNAYSACPPSLSVSCSSRVHIIDGQKQTVHLRAWKLNITCNFHSSVMVMSIQSRREALKVWKFTWLGRRKYLLRKCSHELRLLLLYIYFRDEPSLGGHMVYNSTYLGIFGCMKFRGWLGLVMLTLYMTLLRVTMETFEPATGAWKKDEPTKWIVLNLQENSKPRLLFKIVRKPRWDGRMALEIVAWISQMLEISAEG